MRRPRARRLDDLAEALAWLWPAIALALSLALAAVARADDALDLARICASECGLECAPAECAAIADVLRDRAARRGWSFGGACRRYSSRAFDRERRDPRAWIAHLEDEERPHGWPASVGWRSHGLPRWLALRATAAAILRGEVVSQCAEPPHHWGCRTCGDAARAERAGLREVACVGADGAPTRNAFWRRRGP